MTSKTFPTEIIDRIITNVSEYYTFRELYRIPELQSLVSNKITTLTIGHTNYFSSVSGLKQYFEGLNLFSMTKDIEYFTKNENFHNTTFRLSGDREAIIDRLKQKSLIIIRCYGFRDSTYSQIQTYSSFIHEIANHVAGANVSFHFEIIRVQSDHRMILESTLKWSDSIEILLPSESKRSCYDAGSLEVQIPCVKLYDGSTNFSEGANWRLCKETDCAACNFSVDLIYPNYPNVSPQTDTGIKGVIFRKIHNQTMESIKSRKRSFLESLDAEVENETADAAFKQLCKMIEFTSDDKALRDTAIKTMIENSDTLLLHPIKDLTQKSLIPKMYSSSALRDKLLESTNTWKTSYLRFIEFCISQSNDVVSCVRFNVQQTKETLENDIELHVQKCVSNSLLRLVKLLQDELK